MSKTLLILGMACAAAAAITFTSPSSASPDHAMAGAITLH